MLFIITDHNFTFMDIIRIFDHRFNQQRSITLLTCPEHIIENNL